MTRRGLLALLGAAWAVPARAAVATRLVAVHARGTLDPHRALDPRDGPTATHGTLEVGVDPGTPATQAFFAAHAPHVAVLRGLHLGTDDPARGRRLALTGRADPEQPDVVTRLGRAADLGGDAAGGAWRLGRRLHLGALVDPTRAREATAPWWAPSPEDRADIAAWRAARGLPSPDDPGPTPRPRAADDPATLADDAALLPGLLERFAGVRLVGPADDDLHGLWSGLDAVLATLAEAGLLESTLVLLTCDRGRTPDGTPSADAATLVAGGPVWGGRAFGGPDGVDLTTGGDGSAHPGWPEVLAGALAACGRGAALPGVAAYTGWWA